MGTWGRREGYLAWGVVALVVVMLGVFPVATRRDSFPHSDYPMFSTRRSATEAVDTAVAVGPGGDGGERVWRLDPRAIAATDEVIIAVVTVGRAIRDGTAGELCEEIAARVAVAPPGDVERIEVVTERFDAIAWYEGDRGPLQRWVHADCEVVP